MNEDATMPEESIIIGMDSAAEGTKDFSPAAEVNPAVEEAKKDLTQEEIEAVETEIKEKVEYAPPEPTLDHPIKFSKDGVDYTITKEEILKVAQLGLFSREDIMGIYQLLVEINGSEDPDLYDADMKTETINMLLAFKEAAGKADEYKAEVIKAEKLALSQMIAALSIGNYDGAIGEDGKPKAKIYPPALGIISKAFERVKEIGFNTSLLDPGLFDKLDRIRGTFVSYMSTFKKPDSVGVYIPLNYPMKEIQEDFMKYHNEGESSDNEQNAKMEKLCYIFASKAWAANREYIKEHTNAKKHKFFWYNMLSDDYARKFAVLPLDIFSFFNHIIASEIIIQLKVFRNDIKPAWLNMVANTVAITNYVYLFPEVMPADKLAEYQARIGEIITWQIPQENIDEAKALIRTWVRDFIYGMVNRTVEDFEKLVAAHPELEEELFDPAELEFLRVKEDKAIAEAMAATAETPAPATV